MVKIVIKELPPRKGKYAYLYESKRIDGKPKHVYVAYLGRLGKKGMVERVPEQYTDDKVLMWCIGKLERMSDIIIEKMKPKYSISSQRDMVELHKIEL